MDLYQKNQQSLRKLLAKRQNPCSQIFTGQPLISTSKPTTTVNLQPNVPSCPQTHLQHPQIIHTSNFTVLIAENSNCSNCSSTSTETPACAEEESDGSILHDKVQKKFKGNNQDELKRKSSFEEEREESTSCETHSEGSHEIPDFFLSPMMHPQRGKGPADFKLDDELCNGGFLSSSCDEEATFLKEARTYAQLNEGSCCTTEPIQIASKLKFKCRFNHQWATKYEDMKKKWCPRCEELLKDYQHFAEQNGGKCLNQNFEESIKFSCHRGHSWQLNHKNAKKRWCLDCVKEERNNLKKKCEEERAQREKEEEEYQRKLFEEAKRKAMEDVQNNSYSRRCQNNIYSAQAILDYFQKVDYEVEKLAQKYSVEFMSRKEFTGDISYQQILQVYKILIMPEEILQNYMGTLNADMLKSEFRRFAKIIHPDKNKHPQSGTAFQKIYKVYEVALARIETAPKI